RQGDARHPPATGKAAVGATSWPCSCTMMRWVELQQCLKHVVGNRHVEGAADAPGAVDFGSGVYDLGGELDRGATTFEADLNYQIEPAVERARQVQPDASRRKVIEPGSHDFAGGGEVQLAGSRQGAAIAV